MVGWVKLSQHDEGAQGVFLRGLYHEISAPG